MPMAKIIEKSHIVHLCITCITPPDTKDDDFGLQDRHLVLHPGQSQPDDGSLLYTIDVVVQYQPGESEVRWRGSYVHGTPALPFLYLSLRHHAAQPASWIKRLKIPLPRVSWDHIEATETAPCFAASISGQGSRTVPLLHDGWKR